MTRRAEGRLPRTSRGRIRSRHQSPSPVERRARQVCVANILEHLFGGLDQSSPKRWKQRAYWMLAGLIYERLAVDQESLSTSEVVALAKALGEHDRSAGGKKGGQARPGKSAGGADSRKRLEEVVHDLYGVGLPQDVRRSS